MQPASVVVDGITFRWLEHGEGTPLVLIHGIPTSPLLWRHVLPRIVAGRCFAWEMVGYGQSIPEGVGRDISVAKQAEYLLAWMRHLGLERAVLAGHDLGGGVAQIAAARQPQACTGLFLTNSIAYDSWPIPSVHAMRATGGMVRHFPNALFRLVFSSFIERGHDNSEVASESVEQHWPLYAAHGGAAAFIRQVRSLNVHDTLAVVDRLPELQIPARIVWGASDQFQKLPYGDRLARDLSAPLWRIEEGRHFTPEDHPDIIADELNKLLQEVRSRE